MNNEVLSPFAANTCETIAKPIVVKPAVQVLDSSSLFVVKEKK